MKERKGRDFFLPAIFGIALWIALMVLRGGFEAVDQETFLRLLCDAFFVPGVLLGGVGLLVVVSGEGALDAIHYGLQKLFSLVRREEKRAALPKTYFDFVTLKHGKKSSKPMALLFTGLAFLLAAGVTLIFYYRVIG